MNWFLKGLCALAVGVSAGIILAKAVDARKTAVTTTRKQEKENKKPIIAKQNLRLMMDDKELINRTLDYILKFDLGPKKRYY